MRRCWLAAAAVGLVACGGGGGDETSPTSTVATTEVSDPADRYRAIVQPYNCTAQVVNNTIEEADLEDAQDAAAALSEAAADVVDELDAEQWPTDVQPAIDEMIDAAQQTAELLGDASNTDDPDRFVELWSEAVDVSGPAAVNARQALGIPEGEDPYRLCGG